MDYEEGKKLWDDLGDMNAAIKVEFEVLFM